MPIRKQLHDKLSEKEIRDMNAQDRTARLELCQHALANKERALQWMEAKPYMLAEVEGLRANIRALSGK